MLNISPQFAQEGGSANGIGAFNLNLKSFLFQLITFVIVLLILRRWVFPKLVSTLEARRQTLENSLVQAKKTEEALARAEIKAEEIMTRGRQQADQVIGEAKKAAAGVIADGETAAGKRAGLIIKEAEARLGEERDKLRQELRAELAGLVAEATEKIIEEKIDAKRDRSLIDRAIRSLAK